MPSDLSAPVRELHPMAEWTTERGMRVSCYAMSLDRVPADFFADPDGRWTYEELAEAACFPNSGVAIGALKDAFNGHPGGRGSGDAQRRVTAVRRDRGVSDRVRVRRRERLALRLRRLSTSEASARKRRRVVSLRTSSSPSGAPRRGAAGRVECGWSSCRR